MIRSLLPFEGRPTEFWSWRISDEAHLPTQQNQTNPNSRFSRPYGNPGWPQRDQKTSGQGPKSFGAYRLQKVILLTERRLECSPCISKNRRILKRKDFVRVQRRGARQIQQHRTYRASRFSACGQSGLVVSKKWAKLTPEIESNVGFGTSFAKTKILSLEEIWSSWPYHRRRNSPLTT